MRRALLAVVLFPPLTAQVTITAITTSTNTTAGSTTEAGVNPGSLTYQNDVRAINQFAAGGQDYFIASSATSVAVRRNAVSSTNSSMWVTNGGAANTVVGTDVDNYGALISANNIFQGADNIFSNAGGTAAAIGNVERLDFLWAAGFSVLGTDGFAILDRGLVGAHDALQVAVITSLGTGLANTATWTFGTVREIAAGNYGSNLDLDNSGGGADAIAYRLLRFNNNNNLSTHVDAGTTGTQGLAGTFIRFSDLGIADNTTIYGYAIMGRDVTNTSANLVDWTNATFYPTNTNDADGGVDLAAFNGQISRRVPEPSAYGAMFLSACLVLVYWRRRHARTNASAA